MRQVGVVELSGQGAKVTYLVNKGDLLLSLCYLPFTENVAMLALLECPMHTR